MARLPLMPGSRLIDWIMEGLQVASDEVILADPVCNHLDSLYFHTGILGSMTEEQIEKFCLKKEPFPPLVEERVRKFDQASEKCKDSNLETYLVCVCVDLAANGLDVCGVGGLRKS